MRAVWPANYGAVLSADGYAGVLPVVLSGPARNLSIVGKGAGFASRSD